MQHYLSLLRAITKHLPRFSASVIFDVGAHIGQSSAVFANAFPAATIYAFEPVATSFNKLTENVGRFANVRAFNVALGRRAGTARMTHSKVYGNRIVAAPRFSLRKNLETVSVVSGDDFCRAHNVGTVDFLKIDTEGHDLDVLIGFNTMLSEGRIGLAEAEVGLNPENHRHVPLEAVKNYLEPLGYRLFHMHEQVMDTRFGGRPILRRCNAVFISGALAEANVAPKRS